MKPQRHYRDADLVLRHNKLSFFEPGREIHALISLLYLNPKKLRWQHRSIIDRVVMILRGVDSPVSLALDLDWSDILLENLYWHFGDLIFQSLYGEDLFRDSKIGLTTTAFGHYIRSHVSSFLGDSRIRKLDSDSFKCNQTFVIACLDISKDSSKKAFASLIKHRRALILLENYSKEKVKIPIEELRRRNLSVAESADGFGEIILLR